MNKDSNGVEQETHEGMDQNTENRGSSTIEGLVWYVDMPVGYPDLIFPEDDYEAAFQHATGVQSSEIDTDSEHPGEDRISFRVFDTPTDVPIAHV